MEFFNKLLMDIINFFYTLTGSYGWAIILLGLLIKLILYYPTKHQFAAMKNLQKIQPEMQRIQAVYKDSPEKMNAEMMALYRENKVNPFGGCLPMLIQLPILWAIWQTIMRYQEFFETSYFMWMGSPLSYKYPQFFAKSLAGQDMVLILIYGFSMYLTQKTATVPSDSQTAKTQSTMSLFMTVLFTYMMWKWEFPCALILYWLVFNVFSLVQQVMMMKDDRKPAGAPKAETPEPAK